MLPEKAAILEIVVGQGKTKVIHSHFYWKQGQVQDKKKIAALGTDTASKAIKNTDAK